MLLPDNYFTPENGHLVVAVMRHLLDKAGWLSHKQMSDIELLHSSREGVQDYKRRAIDLLKVIDWRACLDSPREAPPF